MKGDRKMPTSPLLREIRRQKNIRGSKYSISGNLKEGNRAPVPITLRRPKPQSEI